jgi:hypothetical protein
MEYESLEILHTQWSCSWIVSYTGVIPTISQS